MQPKLKYFMTLISTTLLGNQTVVSAQSPPSETFGKGNDSFLGKLGTNDQNDRAQLTPTVSDEPGIFRFSQPHYYITENGGKTAKILVERTQCGSASPPVSVSYASRDGTATADRDYQAVSGTLAWGARAKGDCSTRAVEIPIMDDLDLEGNETVQLNLSAPLGGAAISESDAVLTIVDNDIVGNDGSLIKFTQTHYYGDESAPFATITVDRLNCNPHMLLPASAFYHTTNASGDNGNIAVPQRDYVDVSGVLSWGNSHQDNCGSQSFDIPILNNSLLEGDKTVQLSLSGVIGASQAQSQAVLTIREDDIQSGAGQLRFSRPNYHVSENKSAATITVKRSECGPRSQAVAVTYTSSHGTATQADYQPVSGTLTWEATEEGDCAPKSFSVPLTDDTVIESSETVKLQLSNPTGGVVIEQKQALLTIYDNDFPVRESPVAWDNPGVFSFSQAHYQVEERSHSAFIIINRMACGPESPPATVAITTSNQTAIAGQDYNPLMAKLHWGVTVEDEYFNGDCDPWYVSVEITDDTLFENTEHLGLHLNNPTIIPICEPAYETPCDDSAEAQLDQGDAVLSIIDNDGSNIGFSESNYHFDETNSKAIITVTRSGIGCDNSTIPLPPASISYRTHSQKPSTAASATDYVAVGGLLRWGDTASNESCGPRQFEIPLIDDSTFEGDETLQLQLGTARGATNSQDRATLTIVDNETTGEGPGTLSFSQPQYQVSEDQGLVTITVNRTECGASSPPVSVSYNSYPDTAQSNDYQAVSGILTWDDRVSGDCRPRSFNILVRDDAEIEGNETVKLMLNHPTGGAQLGQLEAILTIIDSERDSQNSQ